MYSIILCSYSFSLVRSCGWLQAPGLPPALPGGLLLSSKTACSGHDGQAGTQSGGDVGDIPGGGQDSVCTTPRQGAWWLQTLMKTFHLNFYKQKLVAWLIHTMERLGDLEGPHSLIDWGDSEANIGHSPPAHNNHNFVYWHFSNLHFQFFLMNFWNIA